MYVRKANHERVEYKEKRKRALFFFYRVCECVVIMSSLHYNIALWIHYIKGKKNTTLQVIIIA